MMSNGQVIGDGSWNLRVFVTDLEMERTLRVKGDLHIGGVMLRLVEDLGKIFFLAKFPLFFPFVYQLMFLYRH
jgi:Kindlin-2 N-terminal domain